MNFKLLLPVVLLATAGCERELAGAVEVDAAPTTQNVEPDFSTKSRLALHFGEIDVHVGDEWDSVKDAFAAPRNGFSVTDLPSDFPRSFAAKGWETGKTGLAAVLFSDKVAAVMQQFYRATPSKFDDLYDLLRAANRSADFTPVIGKRVKYYFWRDGKQTLMLSGLYKGSTTMHITVTLGDDQVLSKLGVGLDQAKVDQRKVDSALEPQNPAKQPATLSERTDPSKRI